MHQQVSIVGFKQRNTLIKATSIRNCSNNKLKENICELKTAFSVHRELVMKISRRCKMNLNLFVITLLLFSSVLTTAINGKVLGKVVGGITTVEINERIEEIENKLKNNLHQLKDESLKYVESTSNNAI